MLAGLQEWSELVSQFIQSSKLTAAYRSLMAGLTMEMDRARLATEFITLATLLQGETKWKKVREEVTGEPGTMALVSVILRKEGEEETRVRKALSILKAADYSMMEERQKNSKTEIEQMEVNMSAEQVLRIDQMLDTVSACLANTTLEPVLGEVVELAVARRGVERQEVESLKTALVGADTTVQALRGALAAKEQQGRLLEGQVVRLVARLGAAKEELGDIRGQHGHLAKEADHTRDKLGKELADKMAEIEQMEEEKKELVAQLAKYKDVITEQNLSLKQLEENEKVLTGQLKKEMKLKEEKEMNLRKREEKLKKTEKKLDEELSAREKVERENEDLKKQCAQLQTLSKSQEQALAKKEKQLQENVEEIKDLRKLQETIFNLSKTRSGSNGSAAC